MKKSNKIDIVSVLTILFILLKITGVINWSWWWVLSPVFIAVGLITFVVLFPFLIALLVDFTNRLRKNNG